MDPTRMGFGACLERHGDDPRLVTVHADISASISITDFEKRHPERLDRVVSVGIAEQNMMSVAAGLALEGRIPITGTYGVFAAGRPWDQIRTTICYDRLNVKIAGAHGGVSVGADGATHQALEEISAHGGPAEHDRGRAGGRGRDRAAGPGGDLRREGPGVHPLRPGGDARRHERGDAARARARRTSSATAAGSRRSATRSRRSSRPSTRTRARTSRSSPAGRSCARRCGPRSS